MKYLRVDCGRTIAGMKIKLYLHWTDIILFIVRLMMIQLRIIVNCTLYTLPNDAHFASFNIYNKIRMIFNSIIMNDIVVCSMFNAGDEMTVDVCINVLNAFSKWIWFIWNSIFHLRLTRIPFMVFPPMWIWWSSEVIIHILRHLKDGWSNL